MRLFAAADLPLRVREELAAWGEACAELVPGIRAVPAARLHLTLVFLGSRPDAEAQEIGDLVTACAAGPVEVELGDALWLSPRRPHVLTVALVDRTGRLAELQARVAGALQAGIGHAPESRPYRPHVTVARVRRGVRVRPGDVALPRVPRATVPLESLTLFRSHPGPAPRYDALAQSVLE